MGKRALVALVKRCFVSVSVLCFFSLAEPLVGLQCVIMVFPDHTHLRFWNSQQSNSLEGLNMFNGISYKRSPTSRCTTYKLKTKKEIKQR